MVLIIMIPFAIMMSIAISMLDRGQSYEKYKDQIVVTNSRIVFGERKSGPVVDVIGTIKNLSSVPWTEPYFHVDFFDSTGRHTDAGAIENFEYYLPANETASFKLSFTRDFPETNYVKAVVRVFGAKDARSEF